MKKGFFLFIFFLSFALNGNAQIFPIIEKEITDWEFRMVGDSVWKPAKVPGTIIDNFVDLSDLSNPLHPYYGDNEKLYQWIGEKDWEFRSFIDIPIVHYEYLEGHSTMEFECLDLFADVYLNGKKWHHENAFYPLICTNVPLDIEDLSLAAKIEVKVVFHSTLNTIRQLALSDSLKFPGGERVYARKPQYEFGWDWGPKFINMGIRKPVKVKMYHANFLEMSTELKALTLSENLANLTFDVSFNTAITYFEFHSVVKLGNKAVYRSTETIIPDIYRKATVRVGINDPILWWPNGMGKSEFYTFEFWITEVGKTEILDKETFEIPLCDIQLIQEEDKSGTTFYFKVNGQSVFAKGANYVPDDSFHPGKNSVTIVDMAADANMNMIRVWGGGTYPDDDFYEQCMKRGIMVWQDFMFACAMYPGNETSVNSYAEESYYQSRRLNKFKNIAVWCGNNENEEGWYNWGWQKELKMSAKDSADIWVQNESVFHSLFPTVLNGDYHNRTQHADYIPSSPKHGWGRKESMTDGDSHYWGVWWGLEPIEKFNEKVPQFMSEFGMQAMPDLNTLKKVIPDSAMNFNSPKFKNHQKHLTGFQTLDHYLKEYFSVPENIEDYAYATQLLQAYTLTIAIEAQRRAMPSCMGSLIWQLNDCWPVTSWSLMDYELRPKIAYSEVSEAFKPTIISVQEEKNNYDIYIVNEDTTMQADLVVQVFDFYGKPKFFKRIKVHPKAKSSAIYFRIPKKKIEKMDPTSVYMNILLYRQNPDKNYSSLVIVDGKDFYFVKPNQLHLPSPDFQIARDSLGIYSFTSKTHCPYVLIPGENGEENNFAGTLGPHNSMYYGSSENGIKWLDDLILDKSRIKCLNTLLKK